MKKYLLLLLCSTSCLANDWFPDEKVHQYIIIENNTEKCFQPELWRAKNEVEREAILNRRTEMDIVTDSQYDIALMTELFGNDATVKVLEDNNALEQFNQKLAKFSTRKTTANTPQECEAVSQYRLHLKKKHIF